jgi:hypothetical protein
VPPTKVEKFCIVIKDLIPPVPCKWSGVTVKLAGRRDDAIDVTVGIGSCVGVRATGLNVVPLPVMGLPCKVGGVVTPIGDSIMPGVAGADPAKFALTTGASVANTGAALRRPAARSIDRSSFSPSAARLSTKLLLGTPEGSLLETVATKPAKS